MEPQVRYCTHCEGTLEPGFVEDVGQGSKGYLRWIPGLLEKGPMGNARRFMKDRYDVQAYVCSSCYRLELFLD